MASGGVIYSFSQMLLSHIGSLDIDRKVFACPFWANSPAKHRSCLLDLLRTIKEVRKHLRRSHASDHYCVRCATVFNNNIEPKTHTEGCHEESHSDPSE